MGTGIAGQRRLPRQIRAGMDAPDAASTMVEKRARPQAAPAHPTDLISPQQLSYEERRDRWLRVNGTLWRAEPEAAEGQRI